MTDFTGKIVLITGVAGGIGGGLIDYFAGAGATLILLDRNGPGLETARDIWGKGRVKTALAVADYTKPETITPAVEAAVAEVGAVDILVNNAGGVTEGTLGKMTERDWRQDMDVNLNGPFQVTSLVLPGMKAKGKGAIVNIGTVNGLTTLGHPAYSAAKAGIISYTKSLAMEYGPFGIRANCVCPGTVRTPVWEERVRARPELFDALKKWYPLQRVAAPSDIAKAVGFLASDDADFITGAILPVDGGLMSGNRLMSAELTLEEF